MLGEITPSIIAFILGILFGTQLAHKITKRIVTLVIVFSIVGALLFGTFTFTYSIYGGYIMPGLGFDIPLITATIGIIIGKLLRGDK
ncbi:MAG: hypothetical protein QXY96_03635 [Candidatus Methanomethylicaceae archaeon]